MITDNRVTLRAIEPEDLDLLYRIENDKELWDVGVTNVPYSRYVLHSFLSNTTSDIYVDKQVRLVIENEAHQVVGLADLMSFDPKNSRAELGLVVLREFRNKGYAREAVLRLQEYALNTLHLHQIYAVIPIDNKASLQIFRKLNYQITAHLSDWLFDGVRYHDAVVVQHVLA